MRADTPAADWNLNGSEDVPRLALRPADAARALGVSPRTLHRLISEGQLRSIKLRGGKQATRIIPVSELERWLAENARTAATAG